MAQLNKRNYQVTFIDTNNCQEVDHYTASDIISLFMIIAKEMMHRDLKYGLKKLLIEDISHENI